MVSHELRVPLTSIKGSTAAALGAARLVAPAETREYFRIIDDQADRMIGLIADLLDAGRIERDLSGKLDNTTRLGVSSRAYWQISQSLLH